jgi:hypothetical protein
MLDKWRQSKRQQLRQQLERRYYGMVEVRVMWMDGMMRSSVK